MMKIWQKKNVIGDGLNGILIMLRDEVQFPWQVGFVVFAIAVALLFGVRGMELIVLITCCPPPSAQSDMSRYPISRY